MQNVLRVACLLCVFATGIQAQTGGSAGSVVGDSSDTPAQVVGDSWQRLQESAADKRVDTRITALNALSLLSGNARAEQMVRKAMQDPEIDVRLAAIVAAGQMDKDRGAKGSFSQDLHGFLDSSDPKLSFTAASTLWELKDYSGENVLLATAQGERAADYSFLKRSEHNASRTLHSPEALAKIAVMQSLTVFVPPVGMGMGAYGYLKGSSGPSPQVTAVLAVAKMHTDAVRDALIVATETKDTAARIAAVEALAKYPGDKVRDALYPLLVDDKLQVRLTASAAYIRNQGGGAGQAPAARSSSSAVPAAKGKR